MTISTETHGVEKVEVPPPFNLLSLVPKGIPILAKAKEILKPRVVRKGGRVPVGAREVEKLRLHPPPPLPTPVHGKMVGRPLVVGIVNAMVWIINMIGKIAKTRGRGELESFDDPTRGVGVLGERTPKTLASPACMLVCCPP